MIEAYDESIAPTLKLKTTGLLLIMRYYFKINTNLNWRYDDEMQSAFLSYSWGRSSTA